jgi:hypothetical protein
MQKPFLKSYSRQTVDELLALAGEYRIDSLVCAFEQAILQKEDRVGGENLAEEERIILGVEALEREVNDGGYDQFFINSSGQYAPMIVGWLFRIGCPKTAEITRDAIEALNIEDLSSQTRQTFAIALTTEDEERAQKLRECDNRYYASGEDIADQLFPFIKANRHTINP